MVTNSEIKKIHTLKNLLKLDDDLYRELLSNYDAKSCKELHPHLVNDFISHLEDMAMEAGIWVKPKLNYQDLDCRKDMPSSKQLRMLEAMWISYIGASNPNKSKKTFRKFLKNKFGVNDLRFLPKEKVSKVKKAISEMINRQLTGV